MAANSQEPPRGRPHPASGLPYQPDSESELLSSTHLFLVGIRSVTSSDFARRDDGLLHRKVRMELELLDVFKGALAEKPGESFRLDVEQRRESELIAYDYHGFWSHEEPAAGRWLVLARGEVNTAAQAMQEPWIQRLLPPAFATDVHAAVAAEELLARVPEPRNADASYQAVRRLLDTLVRKPGGETQDLFARYLWDRIEAVYPAHEEQLRPVVLHLIQTAEASPPFRAALLASFYRTVLLLGATPERCRRLLPPLFALLLQKEAAPLHYELLEVQIYNLLFRPDRPPPQVVEVIPDAIERKRLSSVVAGFSTSRAQAILAWLEGR